MQFKQSELESKTVKQLRQIARYLNCATGDQRERANKAQLIQWIVEAGSKQELDTSGLIEGENNQDQQEQQVEQEPEWEMVEDQKQDASEQEPEAESALEIPQEQEPASTDP